MLNDCVGCRVSNSARCGHGGSAANLYTENQLMLEICHVGTDTFPKLSKRIVAENAAVFYVFHESCSYSGLAERKV
jgi:hypothetical protein